MPTKHTSDSPAHTYTDALLGKTNWNEEWKHLQKLRRKNDAPAFWNKRAKDFDRPDSLSPYVSEFIRRAGIETGSSVLDMGCGTGSIAVPLAKAGCSVLAADFSESMIAEAQKRILSAGVNVETKVLAWEDKWEACGIEPKSFDVVISSRSLGVYDLGSALDKMNATARKRCIATMSCGMSPRMDARVLAACGLDSHHGRDYQYAWNILTNQGYNVDVSFIYSTRKDTFPDADTAFTDFKRMIDDVAHLYPAARIEEAYGRLREWLADQIIENKEAGKIDEKGYPQGALRLREPRVIPWAYLEWQV